MDTPRTHRPEPSRAGFSFWLTGETGKLLVRYEQEKVSRILPELFGYHLAQIGRYHGEALYSTSRIGNKIVLHLEDENVRKSDCGLLAAADSLPFAADSIDVVILPHVLEFTRNPDAVLKEIERSLIAGGHLLVIGFNPWSLWGLWRLLAGWRNRPPWNGHFHGAARLGGWLLSLDFELLQLERFLFRPPLRHGNLLRRLSFLEKLGKFCWPFWGAAYVILAQKRRAPLTPKKMSWRNRHKLIPSGASTDPATMAEPDAGVNRPR